MRKFLVAVLALVFVLATMPPVLAETIDKTATITVGVDVIGSTSLTVRTRNVSNNAIVTPSALNFNLGAVALPPAGNPWVVSDQYIQIVYSSNYGLWGVRIVTDNEGLEGDANDTIDSIAGSRIGPGPDGIWGNADDILAYSGLLSLSEILKPLASQDPSNRAPVAWQVFAAKPAAITAPTSVINADGSLGDGTTIGDWNDDWAYLADKNDGDYNAAILEDADGDGQVDDLTYSMVVVGGGGGGGSLAQHPVASPKLGDGDIAVNIAARFANTNYGGASPVPYILGAGNYKASLYVELIHE